MGIANMKIYKKSVFWNMLLSRRHWQKCDLFLSKKKRRLGRDSWGLYVVIYFKKTSLALSHFFDLRNTFCIKDPAIFGLFSEKTGVFIAKDTKNKVRRIFDSWFARKRNAFVKNDITPINFYKRQRVSETSPCLLFFPDFLLVMSLIFLWLFPINQKLVFILKNNMYWRAKIVSYPCLDY